MSYLRHLRQKIKHNSPVRLIFDALKRCGIHIIPFFIMEERLDDTLHEKFKTGYEEYTLTYLNEKDVNKLVHIPMRSISKEELSARLREGACCIMITCGDDLAGFAWYDTMTFRTQLCRYRLLDNEAYLFDAFVSMNYRGKRLAPYLRYRCYKELEAQGRDIFYSISECTNAQSLKFKEKLGARKKELRLYIKIFSCTAIRFKIKNCE